MERLYRGEVGSDLIFSFFPTKKYFETPSFMEISLSETLTRQLIESVEFLIQSNEYLIKYRGKISRMIQISLILFELKNLQDPEFSSTSMERYFNLYRTGSDGKVPLTSSQRFVSIAEFLYFNFLINKFPNEFFQKHFQFLKSVFSLLHITGLSQYSNPIHFLFGIRYARRPPVGGEKSKFFKFLFQLIYAFQLYQWFRSNSKLLQSTIDPQTVRPPDYSVAGLPADPRLCPICRNVRRNPAALVSTGNVFCYVCIIRWLREKGHICPVTGREFPPIIDDNEMSNYIRRIHET